MKPILGFNLSVHSYVSTWQSTAVQQLLWSEVANRTGPSKYRRPPAQQAQALRWLYPTTSVRSAQPLWKPPQDINTPQSRAELAAPGGAPHPTSVQAKTECKKEESKVLFQVFSAESLLITEVLRAVSGRERLCQHRGRNWSQQGGTGQPQGQVWGEPSPLFSRGGPLQSSHLHEEVPLLWDSALVVFS